MIIFIFCFYFVCVCFVFSLGVCVCVCMRACVIILKLNIDLGTKGYIRFISHIKKEFSSPFPKLSFTFPLKSQVRLS